MSIQTFGKLFAPVFRLGICKKTDTPEVDTQHRHITAHKAPGDPEHGAVTAKHHNKVKGIRVKGRVQPGLYKMCFVTTLFKPRANFFTQLGGAFVAGLADQ